MTDAWRDYHQPMTGEDFLMNTLIGLNFGLLGKSQILREFLTVINEEAQEDFKEMFEELSKLVFKRQKKITRHLLRHSMKKTGFMLSLMNLESELYLPHEIMKLLELSKDDLISRQDFIKAIE